MFVRNQNLFIVSAIESDTTARNAEVAAAPETALDDHIYVEEVARSFCALQGSQTGKIQTPVGPLNHSGRRKKLYSGQVKAS